jgi:hypothetical protein
MINDSPRGTRQAHGVVSEMRILMQTLEAPTVIDEREQLERTVSVRVTAALMVLLLVIIFTTSALPDVGPSLMNAIQAHL